VGQDTGDGTTANTTRNLANLTNQEQWMGLCELASNEHDQEKLGALFEAILRLLEHQQMRLNAAASGMPHDTSALILK
jgi:hypothetical protein